MGAEITVLDFEDAAEVVATLRAELDLPEELPREAELLLALNWASSAPGIDWPEAYYLAVDPSEARWVLWANNPDDPFLVGRESYPVAWCESKGPGAQVGARLLTAVWLAMRDQYRLDRFELVLQHGMLSAAEVDELATKVWGEA